MKRYFLILVLATTMALTGCGDDKSKITTTTTSTPGSTAGTATTSTSSTSTRGTGAPGPATTAPPQGEVTPLASAQALIDAWEAGNSSAAGRVAEVPAVQALFRTPYSSSSGLSGLQYRGCAANSAFQSAMTCSYQYEGGSMHMIMSQTGTLWRVNRIEFIAD